MGAPRGWVVAVASVGLVTSCSSGDATRAAHPDRDQTPTASSAESTDVAAPTNEPLWTASAKPVAQPQVAGEVAVVLLRARGDELDVAGFDIKSGKELWRHPWSPGRAPVGQPMVPEVAKSSTGEELVVFQRPKTNLSDPADWRAPLVAVSAATGVVEHETSDVLIYEPLRTCTDLEDVCARGSIDGATEGTLRFDLGDGSLAEDPNNIPPGSRMLGYGGLYGTGDRPAERIGRVVDGEVLWEVAASDLFGPGYGSDGGWEFVLDEAANVFVGTIGTTPTREEMLSLYAGDSVTRTVENLTETLAFDADTGQRLWREEATTSMCLMRAVYVDGRVARPVRCRMTGLATIRLNDPQPSFDQLRARVEGYDLETGTTIWTRRVPRATAKELINTEPDLDSNGSLVIRKGGELFSISLTDGTISPTPLITGGGRGLCRQEVTLTYALASRGITTRPAGTLLFVCDGNGDPAPADELDLRAVRGSGVKGPDDIYVIAHQGGLHAWRIADDG